MNREDLIAAMQATASPKPVAVTVAGWGTLHVKPPTVEEVDAARKTEEPDDDKQFARGACRVICDESGARLFDATNAEHVDLLAKQPWSMLQQVIRAAGSKGTDDSGN